MNYKQTEIKIIQESLAQIEQERDRLWSEYRAACDSYWTLFRSSGLRQLKAEAAQELLANTHELRTGHEVDGDDDRDDGYGYIGNDDLAEEVKFLVVKVHHPVIHTAEYEQPQNLITLYADEDDVIDHYEASKLPHGSNPQDVWAMAYDLYCEEEEWL